MLNTDKIQATGSVNVVIRSPEGAIKQDFTINNLVVDNGLAFITSRMNSAATAMSHMGIGSDATAAGSTNTTLGTELARVALTSDNVVANAITFIADFPAGTGTGAVTEAAVLNAASAGTMLCRTVFSVVNKGAQDTMTVTWTVTIA